MSPRALLTDTPTSWSGDDTMIAFLRLVLASAGLFIIYIDPAAPDHHSVVTYTPPLLYVLYSIALYLLALRRSPLLSVVRRVAHWGDVGWFTLLIALGNGTNNLFFSGFYFSVLVASFCRGLASGLRVALVSITLFTLMSLRTAPPTSEFELTRFLLRPTFLLVLSYITAHWGGFEITLKRRLALLKDVSTSANPRFGIDRTVGAVMERLLDFCGADACVLVESNRSKALHHLRRASRRDPGAAVHAEPIPEGLARLLSALSPAQAAVYCRGPHLWGWDPWARGHAHDVVTGARTTDLREAGETLTAVLDCASFVTVPLYYRGETITRLYLTARRGYAFDLSDMDFLLQVVKHILPILDNIRLVDRLAADAAEEERHRIARDLHDTVIQSYLGLQMGLAALRQQFTEGDTRMTAAVERLLEVTSGEVTDLRRYTQELQGGDEREDLLPAVRRFAAKFAEATDIAVHVEAATAIRVPERLAAEAFQIVAEGLSNVRRHTSASQATVTLTCGEGRLLLRIQNECTDGGRAPFTPRSITERAAVLGGHARVEQREGDGTVVLIDIPL